MLALTTKPQEDVIIVLEDGRQITVTYVQQHGRAAILGFTAPQTIKIYRRKVLDQINLQNINKAI